MRSISNSTLSTIYFQGILPPVVNGIVIWGSSIRLSDVNRIHTKAARFVMKIKKNIPEDRFLQVCNWKPIKFYYKRAVACKAYKIYKGESPAMLERLITKSQTRTTRNLFKVNIQFKHVLFKKSFAYRASNTWNNLPNAIREKPSVKGFRNSLNEKLLEKITFGSSATGRSSF